MEKSQKKLRPSTQTGSKDDEEEMHA